MAPGPRRAATFPTVDLVRTTLLSLAGVSLLACTAAECCGVGAPMLTTQALSSSCAAGECSLAVETKVFAFYDTYSDEADPIERASVDDRALAELAVVDGRLAIRGLAPGGTLLHATTASGVEIEQWLEVAPLASTVLLLEGVDDRSPLLVFEGSRLRVTANHRDRSGLPLIGHGPERWAATGATLALPTDLPPWIDPGLIREVAIGDAGPVAIEIGGTTTPLALDAVPAGSTRNLRIDSATAIVVAELAISSPTMLEVTALADDGRAIHGRPRVGALAASTDGDGVVRATVDADRGTLTLEPVAAGTATLVVELDGVSRHLLVTVR